MTKKYVSTFGYFQTGIQHIFDAVVLKNIAAFEKLFENAISLAIGKW